MALATINGKAYSHANVRVNIAGIQVFGVKAVSASKNANKANNYGVGGKPVSRGDGNEEFEASITLSMVDIERLRDAAPNRDLTKIAPFPVAITFLRNAQVATCTLVSAEFNADGFDSSDGETDIGLELPLIIADMINT